MSHRETTESGLTSFLCESICTASVSQLLSSMKRHNTGHFISCNDVVCHLSLSLSILIALVFSMSSSLRYVREIKIRGSMTRKFRTSLLLSCLLKALLREQYHASHHKVLKGSCRREEKERCKSDNSLLNKATYKYSTVSLTAFLNSMHETSHLSHVIKPYLPMTWTRKNPKCGRP
jgi:hypothetical protein